jgi:hypothetical protein
MYAVTTVIATSWPVRPKESYVENSCALEGTNATLQTIAASQPPPDDDRLKSH